MSKKLLQIEKQLEQALKTVRALLNGPDWSTMDTMDVIKETVAECYGVTVDNLHAKKKAVAFSVPRQVSMFLCCELTNNTNYHIGFAHGGRDHAATLYAKSNISNRCETEKDFKERVDKVRAVVQQRLQQVAGASSKTS